MQNIGGDKLTNQAAAEFLCLSPRTLEDWRYRSSCCAPFRKDA